MLATDKCRALLGNPMIPDEEIEALRSALYDSVQLAFEVYNSDKNSGSKNPLGLLGGSEAKDIV